MFLMNIKTLCRWLVMTEFEMFLNMLGFFIFSILLCIRVDSYDRLDDNSANMLKWFHVFLPLFIVDLLQANFISIVFIRQLKENQAKDGILRLLISIMFLLSRFSFKLSLYFLIKRSSFERVYFSNNSNLDINHGNRNLDEMINFNYTFRILLPYKFQYVATPLFVHLSLLLFRSCGLKKYQTYV